MTHSHYNILGRLAPGVYGREFTSNVTQVVDVRFLRLVITPHQTATELEGLRIPDSFET